MASIVAKWDATYALETTSYALETEYFLRISDLDRDPDPAQNLLDSFKYHYLSRCQMSLKSVH